jgi:hypothetical protein
MSFINDPVTRIYPTSTSVSKLGDYVAARVTSAMHEAVEIVLSHEQAEKLVSDLLWWPGHASDDQPGSLVSEAARLVEEMQNEDLDTEYADGLSVKWVRDVMKVLRKISQSAS